MGASKRLCRLLARLSCTQLSYMQVMICCCDCVLHSSASPPQSPLPYLCCAVLCCCAAVLLCCALCAARCALHLSLMRSICRMSGSGLREASKKANTPAQPSTNPLQPVQSVLSSHIPLSSASAPANCRSIERSRCQHHRRVRSRSCCLHPEHTPLSTLIPGMGGVRLATFSSRLGASSLSYSLLALLYITPRPSVTTCPISLSLSGYPYTCLVWPSILCSFLPFDTHSFDCTWPFWHKKNCKVAASPFEKEKKKKHLDISNICGAS